MALQHLRSSTAHKRPIPTVMSAGQIAINTNEASPGLFFKDSNGDLVKVGPVHIGTSAPNSSPDSVAATALVTGTVYQILTVGTSDFTLVGASANTVGTVFTATGTTTGTGTVSGQQGNEKGEQWLDTTGGAYDLKIYDGTSWRSQAGEFVNVTGDTMTGALLLDNAASASAPDLSFDGDANTGIYSPGSDQFGITTGGTAALTIDSSQRVGVGTTSPGKTLSVKGSSYGQAEIVGPTGSELYFVSSEGGSSNGTISYTHASNYMNFYTAGSERMRIDSSGNVGIGTSSPAGALHVDAGSGVDGPVFDSGGTANTNHALLVRDSANNQLLRVNNNGNVGIGTSSPTAKVDIEGSSASEIGLHINNTSGPTSILTSTGGSYSFGGVGANTSWLLTSGNTLAIGPYTASGIIKFVTNSSERLRIDENGRLTQATDTYNFTTVDAANMSISSTGNIRRSTSSLRYKTDVETMEDVYADNILNARPVWFRSACDDDNPSYGYWGFIAEEVSEIDPRLCFYSQDENGDQQVDGVAYDRFVPHLLNLIKRQQSAIETLEAKVAALEAA